MSEVDSSATSRQPGHSEDNIDAQEQAAKIVTKVSEYVLKFNKEYPRANILIAGKTGVGKSTLINTVFRGDMAETGIGRPVTQEIREITKPDIPLTIIDTKGLELADFAPIRDDILKYIDARKGEDANTYVHVAWLCISGSSARIEDAELELARSLKSAGLEIIVVLTKVSRFKDNVFEAAVREQFRDITTDVILTRAVSEDIYNDDDQVIGQQDVRGINELLDVTYLHMPAAQKYSLANAASMALKKAKDLKRSEADTAINYFSAAAATVGAVPIPFSDSALLAPIQAAMIVKISQVYGMEISVQMAPQVITSFGVSGAASMIGKSIVTGALKLIPGAGSIIGGAIAATTAGALTKALGSLYATTLADLFADGKEVTLEMALAELRNKIPV